ncbi:MAG: 2-deoxy-5-keto-D-gluconate 6-phosphate aldolase domain-containing protein [Acidimicrobiia bacterium]
MPGVTRRRFVLAGDHREPHLGALLGRPGPLDAHDRRTIVSVKELVAAAFSRVAARRTERPATVALLVDEEYGAPAARAAIAASHEVIMPVEASGLDHFALADPAILDRVLAVGPRGVKTLVRWHGDATDPRDEASLAGLRAVGHRLRTEAPGTEWMLEVIVAPSPARLAAAGDSDTFVRRVRPRLAAEALRALLAAGVAPDVWKVEGIDEPAAAGLVAGAARTGATADHVVLGAGAGMDRVEGWLRTAAATPGFTGFAIGRSLWWDDVRAHLAGRLDPATTVDRIAQRYAGAIATYEAG